MDRRYPSSCCAESAEAEAVAQRENGNEASTLSKRLEQVASPMGDNGRRHGFRAVPANRIFASLALAAILISSSLFFGMGYGVSGLGEEASRGAGGTAHPAYQPTPAFLRLDSSRGFDAGTSFDKVLDTSTTVVPYEMGETIYAAEDHSPSSTVIADSGNTNADTAFTSRDLMNLFVFCCSVAIAFIAIMRLRQGDLAFGADAEGRPSEKALYL